MKKLKVLSAGYNNVNGVYLLSATETISGIDLPIYKKNQDTFNPNATVQDFEIRPFVEDDTLKWGIKLSQDIDFIYTALVSNTNTPEYTTFTSISSEFDPPPKVIKSFNYNNLIKKIDLDSHYTFNDQVAPLNTTFSIKTMRGSRKLKKIYKRLLNEDTIRKKYLKSENIQALDDVVRYKRIGERLLLFNNLTHNNKEIVHGADTPFAIFRPNMLNGEPHPEAHTRFAPKNYPFVTKNWDTSNGLKDLTFTTSYITTAAIISGNILPFTFDTVTQKANTHIFLIGPGLTTTSIYTSSKNLSQLGLAAEIFPDYITSNGITGLKLKYSETVNDRTKTTPRYNIISLDGSAPNGYLNVNDRLNITLTENYYSNYSNITAIAFTNTPAAFDNLFTRNKPSSLIDQGFNFQPINFTPSILHYKKPIEELYKTAGGWVTGGNINYNIPKTVLFKALQDARLLPPIENETGISSPFSCLIQAKALAPLVPPLPEHPLYQTLSGKRIQLRTISHVRCEILGVNLNNDRVVHDAYLSNVKYPQTKIAYINIDNNETDKETIVTNVEIVPYTSNDVTLKRNKPSSVKTKRSLSAAANNIVQTPSITPQVIPPLQTGHIPVTSLNWSNNILTSGGFNAKVITTLRDAIDAPQRLWCRGIRVIGFPSESNIDGYYLLSSKHELTQTQDSPFWVKIKNSKQTKPLSTILRLNSTSNTWEFVRNDQVIGGSFDRITDKTPEVPKGTKYYYLDNNKILPQSKIQIVNAQTLLKSLPDSFTLSGSELPPNFTGTFARSENNQNEIIWRNNNQVQIRRSYADSFSETTEPVVWSIVSQSTASPDVFTSKSNIDLLEPNFTFNQQIQVRDDILYSPSNEEVGQRIQLDGSGDSMVVVANNGPTRVFTKTENTWTQKGSDLLYGYNAAISYDGTMVALVLSDNLNVIRTYKYDQTTSDWVLSGSAISGTPGSDLQSTRVVLELNNTGNILAIGVPEERVEVKILSNNQWVSLGQTLTPSVSTNPGAFPEYSYNGGFGRSVSINDAGTILAVGAPTEPGDSRWTLNSPEAGNGAVHTYMFNISSQQWDEFGYIPMDYLKVSPLSDDRLYAGNYVRLDSSGTKLLITSINSFRIFQYDQLSNEWVPYSNLISEDNNLFMTQSSKNLREIIVGKSILKGAPTPIKYTSASIYTYLDTSLQKVHVTPYSFLEEGSFDDETWSGWPYTNKLAINQNGDRVAIGLPLALGALKTSLVATIDLSGSNTVVTPNPGDFDFPQTITISTNLPEIPVDVYTWDSALQAYKSSTGQTNYFLYYNLDPIDKDSLVNYDEILDTDPTLSTSPLTGHWIFKNLSYYNNGYISLSATTNPTSTPYVPVTFTNKTPTSLDNFSYVIFDNVATITNIVSGLSAVVIPEEINKIKVSAITSNISTHVLSSIKAFTSNSLEYVPTVLTQKLVNCETISLAITAVPSLAFANLTQLLHLDLPRAVTIEPSGVYNATNLVYLNTPVLSSVHTRGLSNLANLTNLNLNSLTYAGEYSFSGNSSVLKYSLPKIEQIDAYAFSYNTNLATVSITPSTQYHLKEYAFAYSNSLSSIYFSHNPSDLGLKTSQAALSGILNPTYKSIVPDTLEWTTIPLQIAILPVYKQPTTIYHQDPVIYDMEFMEYGRYFNAPSLYNSATFIDLSAGAIPGLPLFGRTSHNRIEPLSGLSFDSNPASYVTSIANIKNNISPNYPQWSDLAISTSFQYNNAFTNEVCSVYCSPGFSQFLINYSNPETVTKHSFNHLIPLSNGVLGFNEHSKILYSGNKLCNSWAPLNIPISIPAFYNTLEDVIAVKNNTIGIITADRKHFLYSADTITWFTIPLPLSTNEEIRTISPAPNQSTSLFVFTASPPTGGDDKVYVDIDFSLSTGFTRKNRYVYKNEYGYYSEHTLPVPSTIDDGFTINNIFITKNRDWDSQDFPSQSLQVRTGDASSVSLSTNIKFVRLNGEELYMTRNGFTTSISRPTYKIVGKEDEQYFYAGVHYIPETPQQETEHFAIYRTADGSTWYETNLMSEAEITYELAGWDIIKTSFLNTYIAILTTKIGTTDVNGVVSYNWYTYVCCSLNGINWSRTLLPINKLNSTLYWEPGSFNLYQSEVDSDHVFILPKFNTFNDSIRSQGDYSKVHNLNINSTACLTPPISCGDFIYSHSITGNDLIVRDVLIGTSLIDKCSSIQYVVSGLTTPAPSYVITVGGEYNYTTNITLPTLAIYFSNIENTYDFSNISKSNHNWFTWYAPSGSNINPFAGVEYNNENQEFVILSKNQIHTLPVIKSEEVIEFTTNQREISGFNCSEEYFRQGTVNQHLSTTSDINLSTTSHPGNWKVISRLNDVLVIMGSGAEIQFSYLSGSYNWIDCIFTNNSGVPLTVTPFVQWEKIAYSPTTEKVIAIGTPLSVNGEFNTASPFNRIASTTLSNISAWKIDDNTDADMYLYSGDNQLATTWLTLSGPPAVLWTDIAYGNGVFVKVGMNQDPTSNISPIYYSHDITDSPSMEWNLADVKPKLITEFRNDTYYNAVSGNVNFWSVCFVNDVNIPGTGYFVAFGEKLKMFIFEFDGQEYRYYIPEPMIAYSENGIDWRVVPDQKWIVSKKIKNVTNDKVIGVGYNQINSLSVTNILSASNCSYENAWIMYTVYNESLPIVDPSEYLYFSWVPTISALPYDILPFSIFDTMKFTSSNEAPAGVYKNLLAPTLSAQVFAINVLEQIDNIDDDNLNDIVQPLALTSESEISTLKITPISNYKHLSPPRKVVSNLKGSYTGYKSKRSTTRYQEQNTIVFKQEEQVDNAIEKSRKFAVGYF